MSFFDRFSAASREKRTREHLIPLLKQAKTSGTLKILDVGGTIYFWIPIIPMLDGMDVQITVLNVEEKDLGENDAIFTYVVGNACALDYPDDAFDVVVSNSVIEHVEEPIGIVTWSAMHKFASEVQRVGKSFYVQAPNFWFPIEPHYRLPFFHWLPLPVQAWILMRSKRRGNEKADTLHTAYAYLNQTPRLPTYGDMRLLFPSAQILREKFAFLTKSHTAIYRA